ncbi:MAG: hypothetical protein ACRELY_00945, partial [Polyangiaceae bacterium]
IEGQDYDYGAPPAPPLLQPSERLHDPDSVTSTIDVKELDLSTALEQLDNLDAVEERDVVRPLSNDLEVLGTGDEDTTVGEAGEASLSEEEAAAIAGEEGSAEEHGATALPRLGDEDEDEETRAIARPNLSSLPPAPSLPGELDEERPAAAWLATESKTEAMEHRATWLEEEARALEDRAARARGLLVASEMRAMLDQREAALVLAREAIETWPQVALAHRQLRGLFEARDPSILSQAIAAAAAVMSTSAASLHEALYAADVARISGDDATLRARIEDAVKIAPHEIRVVTLQAALALSKGELTSAALRLDESAPEELMTATAEATAIRGAASSSNASSLISPILSLRRARAALARGEIGAASEAIGELAAVPDLEAAATWLATAFAANDSSTRSRAATALKPLLADGDREGANPKGAARALAARGLEQSNADVVHAALEHASAFTPGERLLLRLLAGDDAEIVRGEISRVAEESADSHALLSAAASIAAQGKDHRAGDAASKRGLELGHLLGHGGDLDPIEPSVDARAEDSPAEMKMLKLDIARRRARWSDVSAALSGWGQEGPFERAIAAALVAERAGDKERAAKSYRAAYEAYPKSDVALRPLCTLDPSVDLAAELENIASALGTSSKAALLRIEAALRASNLDDATKKDRLDRAHEAAPDLPIASFLGERYARRLGSVDDVLKYVRSRRSATKDPIEGAVDAIREALLVVDTDPSLAATRLDEAHHARPEDFALRELYE